MTTATIIDPALQNYAGHHFTAAAGWGAAVQANGLDVRVLAHKECIVEAAGTVPIEKIFSGGFYHVARQKRKKPGSVFALCSGNSGTPWQNP